MGRWVTSKGRRIYIPDEGEENPYAKKLKTKDDFYFASNIKDKYSVKQLQSMEDNAKEEVIKQLKRNGQSVSNVKIRSMYDMDNVGNATFSAGYEVAEKEEVGRTKSGKPMYEVRKRLYEKTFRGNVTKNKISTNKEESTKQKQIAENKRQADERNGKKSKEDIARDKETFRKAKEHETRVKTKTQASKQAIRDAKAAIKQYGPSRGMWKDIKQADKEWQKISKAFAAGEISQEAYTEAYHIFGPNFHYGYKLRHKKKGK